MTITTIDGPISVRFPPTTVQHVKQGNQLTVMIGLVESNAPSASPGTKPGASPGAGTSGSGSTGGGTGSPGGSSSGTKQ